jgi:predicted DNA-binding protein YlxM (UPF0122 family)
VDFVESTIPTMSDEVFRQQFRLSKRTFEELLLLLLDHPATIRTFRTENTTCVEKQMRMAVLITIWHFCYLGSMREISETFGVAKSTVHFCVHKICKILTQMSPNIIVWPRNKEKLNEVATGFFDRKDFPGVVGAIDDCHIIIIVSEKKTKNIPQQKAIS